MDAEAIMHSFLDIPMQYFGSIMLSVGLHAKAFTHRRNSKGTPDSDGSEKERSRAFQ